MEPVLTFLSLFLAPTPETQAAMDLVRFPPPSVAREVRTAAHLHKTYAQKIAVLNSDVPEFGWDRYYQRANRIFACWEALDDCYRPCWDAAGLVPLSEQVRALRTLIGDENYREGLMPLVPDPR